MAETTEPPSDAGTSQADAMALAAEAEAAEAEALAAAARARARAARLTPPKSLRSTQPQAKPVIRRPRHLTPTLQRNLPRRRVSGTVTCGECRLP